MSKTQTASTDHEASTIDPNAALALAREQARAELGLTPAAGLKELHDAEAKLADLRKRVEAENHKGKQSRIRREVEMNRAERGGYEFIDEMAPLYVPNEALQEQFHTAHYVVAAIEKKLGIKQPPRPKVVELAEK
jgi:hypothetical protein